jgi:ribosomal-protein-serine acetyltransferase
VTQLPETVTSPRLTMRVWRLEDAPALARAVNESLEHLHEWMPWAAGDTDVAHYEEFITERRTQWFEGGDATYGVLAGDVVVGGTGLHRRRGPGALEIGYWIHVDHLRRGYATELSSALTDAAFRVEGITRVEILHDRANVRSRAIPERLGFRLVDEQPSERKTSGDEGVDCTWTVERGAWLAGTSPGPA